VTLQGESQSKRPTRGDGWAVLVGVCFTIPYLVGCWQEWSAQQSIRAEIEQLETRLLEHKKWIAYLEDQIAQRLQAQADPSQPSWLTSENQRIKEPLEAHAMESLHVVGFIQQEGRVSALIRVNGPGAMGVHRVGVGSRLGKNFGRVHRIEKDAVVIKEWLPDASCAWTEQEQSLPLLSHAI